MSDAARGDRRKVIVSDYRAAELEVEEPVLGDHADVEHRMLRGEEAVAAAAAEADALMTDARTPVTESVLADADLSIVAQIGTGVDNIDVEAAHRHGVRVTNVPGYSVDEVSTHALALVLALARSVPTHAASVRDGEWDWKAGRPIRRLSERTLGVVGYGRIGRRAAAKAAPFFSRVLAYDPYVEPGEMRAAGVEPAGLGALLRSAHVLTVHAPLTEETEGLLDADAFADVGTDHDEGVLLVNTGRGPIVDEAALEAALEEGRIRAAGLDVLPEEPPTDDRLVGRGDTLVTPHAGWYSEESEREVRRRAAEEVRRALEDEAPENPMNPEWL
jgi:D-3-phosphoglycerate dehydrogenase